MALFQLKRALSDLQRPLVSREGPLDLERALSDLEKPKEGLSDLERDFQT